MPASAKEKSCNAPVAVGNVSVTMLQLSNIAWEVNRELQLDTADGKIQHDAEAMKRWGRDMKRAGRRIFSLSDSKRHNEKSGRRLS